MARIPLLDETKMAPDQRAVFDLFPSNLVRMMAHTDPRIVAGNLRLGGAYVASDLDPQLRELAIMRVAALSDSRYEGFQHRGRALAAGLTEAELDAIKNGDQTALDPRKATILRFVDDCHYRIRVPDATFEAARHYLSDGDLVAITLVVGHYMMTARFVETFDIDLDETPADWERIDH
jgi:alkylhydroperoxidase family enzyme